MEAFATIIGQYTSDDSITDPYNRLFTTAIAVYDNLITCTIIVLYIVFDLFVFL